MRWGVMKQSSCYRADGDLHTVSGASDDAAHISLVRWTQRWQLGNAKCTLFGVCLLHSF